MRYPIVRLFFCLFLLATASCGYQLRGTTQIPAKLKTLVLTSSDPYGPVTRAVRDQLRLNNIRLVDDARRTDLPSLHILGSSSGRDTVSIFADGKAAEHQIMLVINAQVLLPEQDIYPISVSVFRSFFDNPLTALAKDAEQKIIQQEMQVQAAQQLVRKLLAIEATQAAQATTDRHHSS